MTVSRRHVLQGLLAGAALPWVWPGAARSDATPPRRLLVFVVPNGMPDAWWTPLGEGLGWSSTGILDAVEAVRDEVAVVSGLANVPHYEADHRESLQMLLYGGRAEIVGGGSLDQRIAALHSQTTLAASLQLTSERNTPCVGEGEVCQRRRNVSWRGPRLAAALDVSTEAVVRRLFGAGSARTASVLAAARTELARFGGAEVRAWEEGLAQVERRASWVRPASCPSDPAIPRDPGQQYGDDMQIRAMLDLAVLAMQCDLTRVVTYTLGYAGSERPLAALGVPFGHHELSHTALRDGHVTFGRWVVDHFAATVSALAAAPDLDGGRLLDRTDVVFTSDMGDGNLHRRQRIPVLLAGPAAAGLRGKHVEVEADRPIADLWLAIAQAHGLALDTFGEDGTEPLFDLRG